MAKNSNIEWTHSTFNPWRGCTKVSEGCKNCYAMTLSERYKGRHGIWGPKGTRVVASDSMWREPLKWDREAEALGERHRVFCCSLADVFEDWKGPMSCGMQDFEGSHWEVTADEQSFFVRGYRDLPMHEGSRLATMDDYRLRLWELIEATPMLDWLLLTKRPENIMRMVPKSWREAFPRNVWPGTSVEDQKTANERIPALAICPAAVLFLSCEPLLAGVDLTNLNALPYYEPRLARLREAIPEMKHSDSPVAIRMDCLGGRTQQEYADDFAVKGISGIAMPSIMVEHGRVGWVIAGGESGPGARPFDPQDAHSLMKQCERYNVPFFFKQMGSKPYDKFNDQPVKILDPKGHDWVGYDALRKREFPACG